MGTADRSRASRYDLLREYGPAGAPADRLTLGTTPAWALAVIRLGRPLSFSRRTNKAMGTVTDGAFTRAAAPLLITDDCVALSVSNHKGAHVKQLAATLRFSGTHYLDEEVLLPGDWVLAWATNNEEDLASVLARVRRLETANEFMDGLKFVGRVHSVREDVNYDANTGRPGATYSLQAVGFEELDSQFFYDMALATAAGVSSDIKTFMAQLGLDFRQWADQNAAAAGNIKDNADRLIVALINMILGSGISETVNQPVERAAKGIPTIDNLGTTVNTADLKLAPQANKEAPFAYLVPRAVGQLLGRDPKLASKDGQVFGYADILETLVGVQRYPADPVADEFSFYPTLDLGRSTLSRRYTSIPLKGTFLPVNPSFVNRPLWQILQQFLNPAVNEMYTALRVSRDGRVVPTLVARQIPFSTEAAAESKEFPLTRFLSLPRWVVDPVMVHHSNLGRSNATRKNMAHIYGEAASYASNKSLTNQLTRNPPIFDEVDIQRSGIRGLMTTVNCAIQDQLKAPRSWMEAVADWSFGSQYTLNGTLECHGIQAPVAEGDNVEFFGNVYHVEGVTHSCGIGEDGKKFFRTTLQVTNGMPADQSGATADVPVYPGFVNQPSTRTVTVSEGVQGEGDDLHEVTKTTTVEETTDGGAAHFEAAPHPGTGLDTGGGE